MPETIPPARVKVCCNSLFFYASAVVVVETGSVRPTLHKISLSPQKTLTLWTGRHYPAAFNAEVLPQQEADGPAINNVFLHQDAGG
jgi:hypothetical protein